MAQMYKERTKKYEATTEERVERLVAEKFDKQYASFGEFKKDILEKIEQALKDVDEERYTPMEEAVAELEAKYGFTK